SAAIIEADHRDRRMIITVATEGAPAHLLFILTKGSASTLKQLLGRARSRTWATHHREELVSQGRGSEYREATCPNCQSVIDLTGFPTTPQVNCNFCHSIGRIDDADFASGKKSEKQYRLCDECGMFSKPRPVTIFYIYFLLVV